MTYQIRITESALADMQKIYEYIAFTLLVPDTALKQYDRIAGAISTLAEFPERLHLMESEPERSRGIRRMNVDNYSVFYIIHGDSVIVTNVLYGASDISERLRRK